MRPEGARYEHDHSLGCGCVFLGTFHEYDLWYHPADGGYFDMVIAQYDDMPKASEWARTWEGSVLELHEEMRVAYNLAEQRGLAPIATNPFARGGCRDTG